jgi:hypothetical protein
MTMKIPRIHWRKYLTRKVFILSGFVIAGLSAEHYLHLWFCGKGAELALGTILEHTLFEVPME